MEPGRQSVMGTTRTLLWMAAPMMMAQGGITTMGLVDTWVVGRASTAAMGGVALGNAIATLFLVVGLGISMGLEPLASQAFGAKDIRRAAWWRAQGLAAAFMVCVPVCVACATSGFFLPWFFAPELSSSACSYLWARSPGLLFATLFSAERCFLTSVGKTAPALQAVLWANLVNVVFDWLFVLYLGLEAFGVGLATTVSAAAMWWVVRNRSLSLVGDTYHPVDRRGVFQTLRLGWPIAAQHAAEVGIFSGASFLIALEGQTILSAHQIALSIASLLFMSSVGIGVAASAQVGHRIGEGNLPMARQVGWIALALGGLLMTGGGVVCFAFAEVIATSFAPDDFEVAAAAAVLVRIGAAFALSDGLQAVAAGALRGTGDTQAIFAINLLGHGLIGLPMGLYLGWALRWGAVGYWWGLTGGLTATALLLIARFVARTSNPPTPSSLSIRNQVG